MFPARHLSHFIQSEANDLTLRHGYGIFASMKTISAQQAVEEFDEYSKLAHNGEKIMVTRGGEP